MIKHSHYLIFLLFQILSRIEKKITKPIVKDKFVPSHKFRDEKEKLKFCYSFDCNSEYPAAQARIPGYPLGLPKQITKEEILDKSFMKYDHYAVRIKILNVRKKSSIPIMSLKTLEGRDWTNDMIGKEVTVDKITLESWIKYHDIEFEAKFGMYFNEGFNTKVCDLAKELYEERAKMKKAENPIEELLKLMLNSTYGKLIEKAHVDKISFYEKTKKTIAEIHREYSGSIVRIIDTGTHYKVKHRKGLLDHKNIPHCGAMILSMSKVILQELIDVCEGENLYTDTDSLYVTEEGKNLIEKKGPYLLDETELGKFKNDFKFPKGKPDPKNKGKYLVKATNKRGIYAAFLGKKVYLVIVVCDQYFDETISKEDREKNFIDYKIVLKGVSKEAINYVLKNVFNGCHKTMFKAMRTRSTGVVFDLTVGNTKPAFKHSFNGSVCSLLDFTRSIGPF